jgi:hypothetical protein
MDFEVIGEIADVQTFATGRGIRELPRLRRIYGRGHWRKRKGIATVRLRDGSRRRAEIHWYEATGIGRKELKIKRYID